MNFSRDILPLLSAAGGAAAMYGKQNGWFDGQQLPAAVQAGNNAQWANMGRGLNADGTQNTNTGFAPGTPMQLPGPALANSNPLAGAAANASPMAAFNRASGFPGQGTPPAFAQAGFMPPQPQSPAGLLGAPNEASQQAFLRSQGIPGQMPASTASPMNFAASNPSISQLLQYRRGVA